MEKKSLYVLSIYYEVDFSVEILKDLVKEGFTGQDLVYKFEEVKADIPKALETLKKETKNNQMMTDDLEGYLDSLEDDSGKK